MVIFNKSLERDEGESYKDNRRGFKIEEIVSVNFLRIYLVY